MGERLCYGCTKPMDYDADICPSCGASQKEYEKSFFSIPPVRNYLKGLGAMALAVILGGIVETIFPMIKRIIHPGVAFLFMIVLLLVLSIIVPKKFRSKVEKIEKPYDGTGLNLKD